MKVLVFVNRYPSQADPAPGAFVRAEGTLSGTTLDAKTVDIVRPAGGGTKKAGGKKLTGGAKGKK